MRGSDLQSTRIFYPFSCSSQSSNLHMEKGNIGWGEQFSSVAQFAQSMRKYNFIADCRRTHSHVPNVLCARASDEETKSPISRTVLSHPHRRSSDVITAVLLAETVRENGNGERNGALGGAHSLNLYLPSSPAIAQSSCTAAHTAGPARTQSQLARRPTV
jgi:hypothetical protein